MNPVTRFGGALLVAAAFSIDMGWATPGEAPPGRPPPQTTTPIPPEAAQIDEEQLGRYADAHLSVEAIRAEAAARVAEAKDARSINEIRARAEGEILHAIERSGLTLDEFNQIAELEKVDDELRERIERNIARRRR